MSDGLLDERVVEMRFDNADFERNVNQSIKTIDKLKESLDFENAGESFENISAAAAKCDMKPLEDSLEGITVKFNMLEMVAANVLGNITSKIVDAGAKLAKSLTTDQLTAGWAKYDQKTAAVQTIISATGASIDEVNQKLEKLIWFADETSYDFVDMVNNIGKFTSAGVDLDTAVDSMMGISNWAAASGAGIQQASRAMYNLSQAIGMGYVGLTDWRSIELANMATKEFKETVIATALDMGTLQQAADGTVKTLSGKFEVTAENMRNSLKEQWFSTDVLNSALAAYNEFANLVHDRQEQWAEENDGAYLTVSRTIKLLEKEGYAMDTIGAKAFMRAQEATKFSEAVAATADAVSSGWMRTFELIFGNYEQAKKLWTDLANDMYDVFASGNERRNEKLADLMHSNYQKMLDEMPDGTEMNNRLYNKLLEMTKNNKGAEYAEALFSSYDSLEDLLKENSDFIYGSSLEKAFSQISDDYQKEADAAANLTKQLKSGSLTLKQVVLRLASGQYGKEVEAQRKAVEDLGFDYEYLLELSEGWKAGYDIPWDQYQNDLVEALTEQEKECRSFVKAIGELDPFDDFFHSLTELGGRDKLIGGFQNVIDTFKNLYLTIVEVSNGISDLSGTGTFLSVLIDGFYNLTSAFAFTDEKFEVVQKKINDFFHGGIQDKVKEFLYGPKIHKGTTWSDELNSYIPLYEREGGLIDKLFSIYEDHLANLPSNVALVIEKVRTNIFNVLGEFPKKISSITEFIFGHFEERIGSVNGKIGKEIIHVGGLVENLKEKFRGIGNGLGGKILDGMLNTIKKIADFLFGYKKEDGTPIEGAFVSIYDKATAFWERLKDIGKKLNDIFSPVKDFFFGIKDAEGKIIKNNIFGKFGTAARILVDSPAYKSVHDFIFGRKNEKGQTEKKNIFGKIGTAIELITKSSAYQSLHDFIFGRKNEKGETEKKNIFGKIGTAIDLIAKSSAYQSIHDFVFGKKGENGSEDIPNLFGKISGIITQITESSAYKSIHDFVFGGGQENEPNIFYKIKYAVQDIFDSPAFQAIHDFIFGKKTTDSGMKNAAGGIFSTKEQLEQLNLFERIRAILYDIKTLLFGYDTEILSMNTLEETVVHVDGKLDPIIRKIKEISLAVINAVNNFRRWLGLDWEKTDDGFKRIPGAIDSIKAKYDAFVSSEAFQTVKRFIFGEKDSEGNIIQNNIFGKFGTAIKIVVSSVKKALGSIAKEGSTVFTVFDRVKSTIETVKEKFNNWKTIWLTGFNKETFDWEVGSNIEHVDGKFKQFFVNVKNGFNSLLQNAGYESIKEFIFGNKKLGIDNIIIRTLNAIKKKFEELKAAHPWLQSMCDFIDKGIDKIKDKLGVSGKGLSGVIESLSNIFSKVWKSVISFKDNLFKKDRKSIFESLWEFITGPAKFLQGINKTARVICEALLGLAVILLATSIRIGGIEISSPFESFAGTIKDFAISIAIIAATLIGIPAAMKLLKISSNEVASSAILLGILMAGLIACAKILEGDDHKLNLADIVKIRINTIPTLRALSTIILEIAAIAAVFALMARFTGTKKMLTGVGAVAILLAGLGACIALFHSPELFRGIKDVKSRGSELIGISFVIGALSNLLITFGLLIAEFAIISKLIGPYDWANVGILAGIGGMMAFIFALLKSLEKLSGKKISGKVVLSLAIITLLLGELGIVISTLATLNKKVGGMNVVGGVLEIYAVFLAIAVMMDFLSKLKFDKSVEITLGIISGLIFVLGHVLDNMSKTIKKVGAVNSLVAFGEIIGSLYAVIGAIALLSRINIDMKTVANFGIMAGIITVLGGIILGFTKLSDMLGVKFDPKQVLNMILSIGEVVLAIVGLSIIFGLLGKIAEGLNSGFGALAGLIAKTVGIVALVMVLVGIIGGIAKAIDSKLGDGASLDAINYFGDLLESLFNALGKAVGAVIGGFGEGLTDSLSKIGQNITDFITKLDPFIEKIGSLEEKHLAGAGIFTGILLAVAADTVIANITALAGLFGSISAFIIGNNLSNLITNLQPFLTEVVKLDESYVKGTEYFTRILINVGFQSVIAAFTSIAGMFATASPLTVGMNISNLITKMEPFITAVKDINESHVKGAGYFTDLLIAVGKQMLISSVENLISLFGGSRAFSQMFSKLNNEVVPGIKNFSNGISGVTLDKVEKASKVLPAIFDMLTDDHYRTGGLSGIWDWITKGDTDYTAMFSALNEKILPGLRTFASGVNQLDDAGKEMDYSHVGEAAKAIKSVMDIMVISTKGMISEDDASNGIFGLFAKASSADQLKSSFDAITNTVVPAIFALQKALQTVSKDGSEIDPEYIQKVIGSFAGLLQAITDFRDVGLSEEEVGLIGSYIITGLVNALDEGTIYVKEAAQRVAKGLVEGLTLTLEVHSPSKVAYEIGQFVAAGLTEGLRAGEGMTWSMARAFGKGTVNALEEGLADFDSVSQHAINMVTMDLLDENRFDMPDFSFINRFGNEDIDFDKMREFLTKNFSGVFDQDAINNFVGSYRQAMKEVKQTINDEDYNSLMVDIAEGDYGFGHDAIIKSLTEELGTVEAANQAWEDYTDVLSGNLKINQDLLKQRKQNPPMTEEQWMAMLAWDQEGIDKHNHNEFRKLAEQNGTTWQEEAAKQGYDPKRIQEFYNKQWQTSEQYYDLYIKQKAENEILEEQTRLVDEVIEASQNEQKAVQETAITVDELNESFEASRNGRNYFVDDADGLVEETEAEQKAIRATQKALDDLNESRDAIRSGEEIFLDEADGILIEREGALRGSDALQEFRNAVEETTEAAEEKNNALTEEGKELDNVAESAQNAAKATENTATSGKYSSQLDYTVLNSALTHLRTNAEKVTEEEAKMLSLMNQAINEEGYFGNGETNRVNGLRKEGITLENANAAFQYSQHILTAGNNLENFSYKAKEASGSTEELGDSVQETGENLSTAFEDSPKWYQGFMDMLSTKATDALSKGKDGLVELSIDDILSIDGGDGFDPQELISAIGFDENNKATIDFSKYFDFKSLNAEDAKKLLSTESLSLIATNMFGDIFGENGEVSIGSFANGFIDMLMNPDKAKQSAFTSTVETVLNMLNGTKNTLDEISNTETNININDSQVEAAISMADQLKKKYTLTGYETDIAKQGAQNLQNGVALTEKQADILKKIWDGTMIGMYESGDKRVQMLKQLFDIDWETLASFSDGFGNLDLSTATSSAQEFADTVIKMGETGEKYSTEQLFKDIQEGKWGVGEDRVKALEKAGYDVEKVQEKFLQWHSGDSKVAELPDDYLKVSEAEKNAAEQAEKMNAVLNQTPEGAFRSVADFLDGVNKAVENKETASAFKSLMTDISESMKTLTLSDASNFEKVAGFLTAVRTAAKESSTIAQDFKAFVDGIKDSVTQLGDIDIKNPEGMDKVKDFLNNIKIENKDTLDSVSSFIGNIVEFATGANAGGDYSTKLVESIDSLMTSINGIELNKEATTPVVRFLHELTNSAGILEKSDSGIVQTFISNIYTALENTTDKAASAADTIAQVIVDTLASYYPQLATIGHNFVWWLARGILKARNLATDAGESVAGALMNSLKDYAVSKAQKSGGDFVSNFVTGMNSPESQKVLQRALDNLFNPKTEAKDLPSGADALAEKLAMKNGKEAPESEKTEPQKETGPSAGTKYGQQFVQDMSAAIEQGAGTVSQSLTTVGETLSASINLDTDGISAKASDFLTNLASGLTAGFEVNQEALTTIMGEVNSIIASGVPDGHGLGYSYMEGIRNGLLDGAADFNLGQFLPEGLVSGMNKGASDVKKAGWSLFEAGKEGVTSAGEIRSPSRVFMRLGSYMVQGLAIGIEDSSYIARDSAANMANMMSAMFSESVANISDLANEELNLDPVIRPVIDMSDVYDSAGKIDAVLSSDKALSISAAENAKEAAMNVDDPTGITVPGSQTFIQNNYSPKALSRLEIYRQTRNQFAMLKTNTAKLGG